MIDEKQVDQILNKVKNAKLRELLNTYRSTKSPIVLLDILDYLNVKLRIDAISAIIPQFNIGNRIWLGGIIPHGKLFRIELIMYDDGDVLIDMYKADTIILYHEKGQKTP
jgi:hypothetical protein